MLCPHSNVLRLDWTYFCDELNLLSNLETQRYDIALRLLVTLSQLHEPHPIITAYIEHILFPWLLNNLKIIFS